MSTETTWVRRELAAPTGSLLARTRLLDRLDGVLGRPLTVVSAPMGAGKSELVGMWCRARCPGPVRWWVPGSGPDAASTSDVVVDADAAGAGAVLVLDGVEEADVLPSVLAAERAGAGAHVVVLARAPFVAELAPLHLEPGFDQLVDTDLQLDADELGRLVELLAGASPDRDVAAAVCDAIEGWVAAGVLVASGWPPGVTVSNHRSVLARRYEAAAALAVTATLRGGAEHLPALLELTAGVPELAGGLCDVLTGRDDSRALLAGLAREGALLGRHASSPELVRLHPLAREGFGRQTTRSDADRRATLRTAAAWFDEHRHPVPAVRCHAALEDWNAVGETAIAHLHELEAAGRVAELADVVAYLPPTFLLEDARWLILAVWMRYLLDDVGGGLALVNVAAPHARTDQLVIAEYMRAVSFSMVSDTLPALEAAERGLERCDELDEDARFDDVLVSSSTEQWRTILRAVALIAGAQAGTWERVASRVVPIDPVIADRMRPGEQAAARGRRSFHAVASGDLVAAEAEVLALRAAIPSSDQHAQFEGVQTHLAMAEVHRGRGAFDLVEPCLEQVDRLRRNNHNLLASVAGVRALLAVDLRQPERALEVIAEHRAATDHVPPPTILGWLAAAEGSALAALGDAGRARLVLTGAPRTTEVAAALMLVTLDRGDLVAARTLLDAWPEEPTVRSAIHRHLAAAALHERIGARTPAVDHLDLALRAAAPHGLVQPFLAAGAYVLPTLRGVIRRTDDPAVAEFAEQTVVRLRSAGLARRLLTERERLVMHHLATGATLPAIAERLTVSVNTVKTQVRSIYEKLEVASRAEAVELWQAAGEADAAAR